MHKITGQKWADIHEKEQKYLNSKKQDIEEIQRNSISEFKQQVKDIKAVTQPLFMGTPVHKIEVGAKNFYSRDILQLKNLHKVFQ